jgi:hypothetical protein
MINIDRRILSAVSLGISSPAFGWPAGVGLRWSLPMATFLHGGEQQEAEAAAGAASASAGPRGWPDNGYRIYRQPLENIAKIVCFFLRELKAESAGQRPLHIGLGVWVDWISEDGAGSVADQISNAGAATIYNDTPALAMRIRVQRLSDSVDTNSFRAVGYGSDGKPISSVGGGPLVDNIQDFMINGPDLAHIEIMADGVILEEVCVIALNDYGHALFQSEPIATVVPLTDPSEIISVMPPQSRASEAEELAAMIREVLADYDVIFRKKGMASSSGQDDPLALATPTIDMLMLAALEPWMAQALGILFWDSNALPETQIYGIAASWQGREYAWILPPVTPSPPELFALPAGTVPYAHVLPPARVIPVSPNDPFQSATSVKVSWTLNPPGFLPPNNSADHAVRFILSRASADSGSDEPEVAALSAFPENFMQLGSPIVANSSRQAEFVDFGVPDGYHIWKVTGIDLFGRPSRPVQTQEYGIWDTLAPPPPSSSIRGAFLDQAAVPADGTSSNDPFMTSAHAAWLMSHRPSPHFLYVGFDWPPASSLAAPNIREFRVYAKASSDVPRANAKITAITLHEMEGTAEVHLDRAISTVPAEALAGGTLSDGQAVFEIVSLSLEVAHPSTIVVRLRYRSRRLAPISDANGTTTMFEPASDKPDLIAPVEGSEVSIVGDIRSSSRWGSPINVIPYRGPLVSHIDAILSDRPDPERTLHVRLAHRIEHPDPANGIFFEGGWLEVRGDSHRVTLLVTESTDRRLPPGRTQLHVLWPAGTPAPQPGDAVVYHPGYGSYNRYSSFRRPDQPIAYALVTVTAIKSSSAPNTNVVGGFESATGLPATVVDVLRTRPLAPSATGQSLMGWPDVSGLASYVLRWPAQPGLRYLVLRALDAAIFNQDRILRSRMGSSYGSDDLTGAQDLLARTSSSEYPDPENTGMPNYKRISNPELLQRIASLPGNARAFAALSDTPIGIQDLASRRTNEPHDAVLTENGPGYWLDESDESRSEIVFVDRLPGIGRSRYFYRIQAVDAAGNRSGASLATPPVASRIDRLPLPPIIAEIRLGNRSVTVLWEHPPDGSVTRYVVYFGRSEADLARLEMLRPERVAEHAEIVLGNDAFGDEYNSSSINARWGWLGKYLPVGEAAVAVVEERVLANGTVIRSSPTLRTFQVLEQDPPSVPTILFAERQGPSIRIKWITAEPRHDSLVEWRVDGDNIWQSAGGWSTTGQQQPLEAVIENVPTGTIDVRIRARNGITISSPASISVPETLT